MFFTLIRFRFFSFVIGLLFFVAVSHAQVLQSGRYEIPLVKTQQNFEVIPCENDGLFVYRRLFAHPNDQIELTRLDTALKEQWKGYLPIEPNYFHIGKYAANDRLYLLERYKDFSRNNFQLTILNQDSGTYTRHVIKNFIPFSTTEFQVTKKAVIIGGYYNQVPVVIYFSLLTGKSKIFPGLLNESGELTQIKAYTDGSVDILISAKNHAGQRTIFIKNYDADGDLLRNYALIPGDNKNLIFARSIKTDKDVQLVSGVYGSKNAEYSRGMFIASIDPSGLQQIKYYNFGDLQNFFKYMKVKREQRVKERIHRRRINGKQIRFSYRFLVHELVPYNNQYILLGEAFYPKYITLDRSYYGGFFTPFTFNRNYNIRDGRIFDGYYYTHAVVMGFNPDGKLLWDNSFEINDVKTQTLEQFVKLKTYDDKIALLYVYENQLRSKIIKGNEVIEGKTKEPIKGKTTNEIVKSSADELSKLNYWYKDHFYAYGVQEVVNPTQGKRKVFFINKLSSTDN